MWIYAVILSAVGLLCLLSLSLSGRQYWIRIALTSAAVILLTGFIGLRDQVGADWGTYDNIYDFFSNIQLREFIVTVQIEPCYGALNYLAHLAGGDVHLVNLVCAFLMLYGLVSFSYLVDLDACLVLFLSTPYLLFAVGMGYTRQAVAIGIGYAALGYWVRGRRKKCYAAICFAIGFHYSAVFLFLLIAMKNRRRALIIIPCALMCAFVLVRVLLSNYFSLYVQNTEDLHSGGVWLRISMLLMGVGIIYTAKTLAKLPGHVQVA